MKVHYTKTKFVAPNPINEKLYNELKVMILNSSEYNIGSKDDSFLKHYRI